TLDGREYGSLAGLMLLARHLRVRLGLPADPRLVRLDRSGELEGFVLRHELVADQVAHPPRRLVGDADLALNVLRGDSASSASHQVHDVEPQVQRRARAVENRPRRGMQVMAAGDARPRLPLLRRFVPLELALLVALRAMRVL